MKTTYFLAALPFFQGFVEVCPSAKPRKNQNLSLALTQCHPTLSRTEFS